MIPNFYEKALIIIGIIVLLACAYMAAQDAEIKLSCTVYALSFIGILAINDRSDCLWLIV